MKDINLGEKLSINIGNVSVCINSPNKNFVDYLKQWYKEFITVFEKPDINLSIYEVPSKLLRTDRFPDPEYIDITFESEENKLYVNSNKFMGEFNLKNLEGELKCVNYLYFNPFLRIVFALFLLQNEGFLIHAASIIHNNNGYIFPGGSGAGKSTISKISDDSTILTDELTLVRKVDEKFVIYGTPFWGEYEVAENKKIEVKELYFLKKDDKNYIKEISPSMAIKMILPNIFFFNVNKEFTNLIFNLINEFIETVPCYELHFLPDPSFWRLIDAK